MVAYISIDQPRYYIQFYAIHSAESMVKILNWVVSTRLLFYLTAVKTTFQRHHLPFHITVERNFQRVEFFKLSENNVTNSTYFFLLLKKIAGVYTKLQVNKQVNHFYIECNPFFKYFYAKIK